MTPFLRRIYLFLVILLLAGSTGNLRAGEEYFLLMFGSQRTPPDPNHSHTFATFVKVSWLGDGPCPPGAVMESHTISWLPANLKVRLMALRPECGHNFSLQETLDYSYAGKERVSMWGPYPIQHELYRRALNRKAELERGQIRYKANDAGYRSNRVTNCIHAVSTIAEGPRLRIGSPGWGETASYFVLKEFEPWIIAKQPVTWVGSALDLDRSPIIYRDFQNPRSNALASPVLRLLGRDQPVATFGPPVR